MAFEILFWTIGIISVVCFLMDFARAKPEIDRSQNFVFDFGMLTVMVCTTLIAGRIAIFLTDEGFLDSNLRAIIITESVFLLAARKLTAIVVQGLVWYLRAINNAFAKKIDPKLIVSNPDPLASKDKQISLGVLRIGHTIIYAFWILATAIISALPGITNSRINILLYKLSVLPGRIVGTIVERVGFMLWIALLAAFWTIFFCFIIRLYRNYTKHLDKKDSEIKPIKTLVIALVVLLVVRKVFSYIFFSLPAKYIFQDLLFWVVIIAITALIGFLTFMFISSRSS